MGENQRLLNLKLTTIQRQLKKVIPLAGLEGGLCILSPATVVAILLEILRAFQVQKGFGIEGDKI